MASRSGVKKWTEKAMKSVILNDHIILLCVYCDSRSNPISKMSEPRVYGVCLPCIGLATCDNRCSGSLGQVAFFESFGFPVFGKLYANHVLQRSCTFSACPL